MSTSTKVIVVLVLVIIAGLLWKIYDLTQERDILYRNQQDGYEAIISDLNGQIKDAKARNDSLQERHNGKLVAVGKFEKKETQKYEKIKIATHSLPFDSAGMLLKDLLRHYKGKAIY